MSAPSRREPSVAPSTLAIEPLTEQQLPRLAQFLTCTFGPEMLPIFVNTSFQRWKLFEPFPGWDAERSWVVRQADEIVAHAALWPTFFRCSQAGTQCGHILDWAASVSAPGVGVTIYQHLLGLTDAAFVVGGSDQAKRLLPRIGFRAQGVQRFYAKVIRPWAQFRSRPISSPVREVARLARNTLWSFGIPSVPAEWQAQQALEAAETLDHLTSSWEPRSYCSGRRSRAWLTYILRCPIAKVALYNISRAGKIAGYFLLSTVGGQCRIIDMFLDQEGAEAWRAAYGLALQTAAAIPTTCEVVATASLPWLGEVLEGLGFRLQTEKPIFLYDPKERFAGLPPLLIQMVDSDAFFLHSPSYPYFT